MKGAGERSRRGVPDQIHLCWTQDPSTTLTVVWHTASAGNPALVQFRPGGKGGGEWQSPVVQLSFSYQLTTGQTAPSPGSGHLHRATLGGLSPGAAYEYRVSSDPGCEPAWSAVFKTRTAPPPGPADIRFAFLCDTGLTGRPDGNTTGARQVMDEIAADEPLFILGGGDYAYGNRDGRFETMADAVDAWFVQTQPLSARFPFMAQYGNHEIFLEERYEDWAPRFAHPPGSGGGRNYSFDVADVHFTALFVPGPPPEEVTLAWLEADLAGARERGVGWIVVFQHEPIYGHGHSHPARPEVRATLAPIFERHAVDLHLSGHDQNYERTFPLVKVPHDPTRASCSMNEYRAGAGVIYAKVSPGGKMSEIRDDFSRFTTEKQPFMAVREDSKHHYAVVNVKAAGRLEFEAWSLVGDGSPKTLLDSFAIVAK